MCNHLKNQIQGKQGNEDRKESDKAWIVQVTPANLSCTVRSGETTIYSPGVAMRGDELFKTVVDAAYTDLDHAIGNLTGSTANREASHPAIWKHVCHETIRKSTSSFRILMSRPVIYLGLVGRGGCGQFDGEHFYGF